MKRTEYLVALIRGDVAAAPDFWQRRVIEGVRAIRPDAPLVLHRPEDDQGRPVLRPDFEVLAGKVRARQAQCAQILVGRNRAEQFLRGGLQFPKRAPVSSDQ